MNNKLVVVADLGYFKAYRLETNNPHSTPRLELIEELHLIDAHRKTLDRATDLFGRNHSPMMNTWATYSGERRHNIELERKRRLVKQLAHSLNALLHRGGSDGCYLAASKEISHQVLNELPRNARVKIEKIIACDLTKADKSELMRRFDVLKTKVNETPYFPVRDQMRRTATALRLT